MLQFDANVYLELTYNLHVSKIIFSIQPDRFSVVGLSTNADNWCSVGAYTRLARYSDWIYKSIEYFEGRPLLQPRKQLDSGEISDEEEGLCYEYGI